jgi:hypothetical protein
MNTEIVYIYTLSSPVEEGVRYVGATAVEHARKTRGPARRFITHLSEDEQLLLAAICHREQLSQAEAIRQAIKRWKD